MYYLPAALFNFIFRDKDLWLIEKKGNTGPALAGPHQPAGPLGTHINA